MKKHSTTHPLLREILEEANRQGFNQKSVAQKAEMAPESLSRIIRTGKMELSTLEKLANTVGMKLSTSIQPIQQDGSNGQNQVASAT